MPKAAETLRELAEKARRKSLPNRHELVAVALDIGAEAMEHEREWFGKDGDHIGSSRDPQFAAANRSVETAAALALKFEAKPDDAGDGSMEEFVQQVTQSGMAPVLMTKLAEAMAQKKGASA